MKYIVSKQGILNNISEVKKLAQDSVVIGVVKGNGYGFGIEFLAGFLRDNGIDFFAVTEVEDLILLRKEVLKDREKYNILMLRSTCDCEEIAAIAENGGIFTVGSQQAAEAVNAYAESKGERLRAHIKIDTGMSRYGFLPTQIEQVKSVYGKCTSVDFEGIYTHFSSAFTNSALTRRQLKVFTDFVDVLKSNSIEPGMCHCANSSALFGVPESRLDAVRVGSAFAGRIIGEKGKNLTRVGYIESTVIETKDLSAGTPVGYNGTYVTKSNSRIAIIPVGHTDGWGMCAEQEVFSFRGALRKVLSVLKGVLTNRRKYVTIGDKNYPVVGQIGLSHTAVDITGSSVKAGDIVKLDTSPLNINPLMQREYV